MNDILSNEQMIRHCAILAPFERVWLFEFVPAAVVVLLLLCRVGEFRS